MSNYVDTKALRAHLHELRDWYFDIDEGNDSIYADGGGPSVHTIEDMRRKPKEAICALVNAAPALLDAADERDKLSADWDDAHSALCEVCSATDKDHDLPLRLSEMAETVVGWLKAAQAERDALRARVAELEREVERVRRQNEIAHRALAEAASRFAAKDMEGVRLLLCDRNAQSNAAALATRAEVKP